MFLNVTLLYATMNTYVLVDHALINNLRDNYVIFKHRHVNIEISSTLQIVHFT